MKLRFWFQLIFIVFYLNVSGQQRNIFLRTVSRGDNHRIRYKDYVFTNKEDTTFLSIEYGGDFGRISYAYHEFKNTLPDGEYHVYIDSVLFEKATFVNNLRNGMNYTYHPNGEYLETPYNLGQIDGKVTRYINRHLFSEAFFVKNKCMLRIVYDETGNVKNNEFYINTAEVRNEVIDENNKIKKIVDYKMLTKSEDPSLIKTELNGRRIYNYKEGNFIIHYKKNKIIDWKWVENK